ncbi:MAPK/MAK/MRK overlapping kinase-like isoform X2 [Anthonomus grandis grandis]|uniref:MAPK/MAK/MRK overlapping kinase-like isoform X2 n=1 Tax=Anthonomus grandis grandis TaxID=2921223 RepID=UPI002166A4E3|nr:MAPK/MAK/MRK overlapping kinase-like isoform X2 [Anthonomus grandis grandis]
MFNEKSDSFHSKYKVLEKIGEGSFSEVLKCMHKSTGVYYAVKRLKKCYKSQTAILTCAEVVAAQKVPFHPNILNIFEYHYDSFSGHVSFVFELMDMSLYDHLRARNKADMKPRGLSEKKSKEYLYQLLRGLEHLHRNGLFHRDVKPENILMKFPSIESMRLQKTQKYEIIKLADLGSVRGIYSVPPYTEYISTRWYRSPECLLTNGNYGPKMDVWAAGCVFYEIMTFRDHHASPILDTRLIIFLLIILLSQLPLFPGSNEIDQLYKIHHILGSPTMQFINKLKSRSRNCVIFPKNRGTGLDSLLPQVTRETRGILELMIEYDPDKRVNVRRLLRNPYFDDVRYKFEPIMEGNRHSQLKSQSFQKIPEFRRRAIGDVTLKLNKREHKSEDTLKRRSLQNSACSESKGSTPFIEIPYYTPCRSSGSKGISGSLPLVDYKISRYVDSNRDTSSESVKSNLSKKSSIKKSVEIILKSSRNSESNSKLSRSKEKYDASVFYSKSLMVPRNNKSSGQSNSKRDSSRIKSINSLKNSSKYSKPSAYYRVFYFLKISHSEFIRMNK